MKPSTVIFNQMYKLLRNTPRVFFTSFILSSFLSTIIFIKSNYDPFYYTKGNEYQHEAKQLCKVIEIVSDSLSRVKGQLPTTLNAINKIISVSPSYVEVSIADEYLFDNGKRNWLDKDRSIVRYGYTFKSNLGIVKISTQRSNQPRLTDHLYRAWTWSMADYLKDRTAYHAGKFYLRSEFLYKTLAVVWGFSILMLFILKLRYEEAMFLNSQLAKEGYYLRKEFDLLKDELDELLSAGAPANSDLIMDKQQKLMDLEAELTSIHAKTNVNILNAKMEYFEPDYIYSIADIRDKLRISTITNNSDISVISYSDRYFQRESHVRFFSELLGLKGLNANHLRSINISVPILKGQDREQKEEEIKKRFAKYLPTSLLEKLNIDVHNIHDKEYLHMRVMEIVGGHIKLTLTLDKGMDSLEPRKDDKEKYSTSTRTYAVVAYAS